MSKLSFDLVSLAEQQKLQLELHTNLPIGIIHGQMNTATWEDPKQFGKLFKSKVVFVVTHAILNQLLQHAIVKWTDIALLIVDECHHVLGSNHEYRKLMNYYRELKDKCNILFILRSFPLFSTETTSVGPYRNRSEQQS